MEEALWASSLAFALYQKQTKHANKRCNFCC